MIINIIDLLEFAKGETENIRIAQGKYKLPENMVDGYKLLKKQMETLRYKLKLNKIYELNDSLKKKIKSKSHPKDLNNIEIQSDLYRTYSLNDYLIYNIHDLKYY